MSKRFTDDNGSSILHFTDNVSAFNGLKKATIKDKGQYNNQISALIFDYLIAHDIPTHFIETVDTSSQRVLKVDMVPVEIIIRNKAAGPWMENLGFKHGDQLKTPILEYRYKSNTLKDPLINSTHILALSMCSQEELTWLHDVSLKINEVLQAYFLKSDMDLVDLKLEFGYKENRELVLADSLTPDTMRIWDLKTQEPMDKDVFRKDLGKLEKAYAEVLRRLEEQV